MEATQGVCRRGRVHPSGFHTRCWRPSENRYLEDVVVERHDCRESGCDDQDLEQQRDVVADDGVTGHEDEVAAGLGGDGHHVVQPQGVHDQPARHGVEHAHECDRQVGGPGDGPGRVAGFLAVDGRTLETDEGGVREHQRHSESAGQHHTWVEGLETELRDRNRVAEQAEDAQDGDHEDFEGHEHPEYAGAGMHALHTQAQTQQQPDEGVHPPRQADTQCRVQQFGCVVPEPAVEAGLDCVVGEDRQRCRSEAGDAAEPQRDVRVEGAGVGDVAAHRHITDGEDHQHHRRDDEGAGHADAVAGADDDREQRHHHGQRGCGGDDVEEDARNTQGVLFQAVVTAPAGFGGGGRRRGRPSGRYRRGDILHGVSSLVAWDDRRGADPRWIRFQVPGDRSLSTVEKATVHLLMSSARSVSRSSWPPTIARRPASTSRSRVSTPMSAATRSACSRKLEYTPA